MSAPAERTSMQTLIALALAVAGFALAFGLPGCAEPAQAKALKPPLNAP